MTMKYPYLIMGSITFVLPGSDFQVYVWVTKCLQYFTLKMCPHQPKIIGHRGKATIVWTSNIIIKSH